MLISFAAITLCLICAILVLVIKVKKVQVSEKNALEQAMNAQEKLEIFKSMGKTFSSAYFINLSKNTFQDIVSSELIDKYINKKESAQECLYQACNVLMAPEFTNEMILFTDLSTLDGRMENKNTISCDFIGIENGWSQAFFIAGERYKNGSLKNVFFATRAIQEEKEREEAQNRNLSAALTVAKSANRAKSAFLFNMSHDIRTPMNAISGFTELLEKNLDNKEVLLDYIQKIKSCNKHLLTLVNNVLEMARIESGRTIVEEEYWDIRLFNDTLTSSFNETVKKHGLHFKRTTIIQHPHVLCDTTKIQKIFLNLLSNAIKFTPVGGTISFDMTEIPSGNENIALFKTVIEDNGIGMSEEYLNNIYDEFSREHTSTESGADGLGLGMAIVKNLIDFLKGTINIESTSGKGTKITVTLPLKIASQQDIESPKKEAEALQVRDFSNKRVLLAEDNELNAEIAMAILRDVGIIVDRAENGKECVEMLEKAEAGYYDVVLMDIQMPIMNGYEATREIRVLNDPRKSEIPVIAMTANAFDEDRRTSLIAGMNAHLAKPIDVNELFKTLNRFI